MEKHDAKELKSVGSNQKRLLKLRDAGNRAEAIVPCAIVRLNLPTEMQQEGVDAKVALMIVKNVKQFIDHEAKKHKWQEQEQDINNRFKKMKLGDYKHMYKTQPTK